MLHTGDTLHGFTVTRVREVSELSGTFVEMTHDRTGAQLCWLDNGLDNKLFSVAFKTIPSDSTGVFHILEHSVLCGSEKFPLREPFVDLLKSSMQTFLNAMTFPDKTLYPISSRNDQDYLNLSEVYLDAVFAPRLRDTRNIFYQEGWHMELDGENSPSFKGVVFNEMKGAMSSIDDVIDESMNTLLFPDNCYGYNSGGDPTVIPTLTYENYKASWEKFYHPSNARFFLDGAVPLDRILDMIDSYLSRYDHLDGLPDIEAQTPVANSGTVPYELGAGESTEKRTHFTMGKIAGSWDQKTRLMAVNILCDALAGTNESPLTKAVLDAGLGQDVQMGLRDSMLQPWLMLSVRNLEAEQIEPLRALLKETVSGLVENGIDKADLIASLNNYEFNVRCPQEPQGLIRCINSLNSWLYGGDPLQYLTFDRDFAALRTMVEDGSFNALLKELLLDENGLCTLIAVPDAELGEKQRAAENAVLQKRLASMSGADIAALRAENEALLAWQSTPDAPEVTAMLPVLPVSEIAVLPKDFTTQVHTENGITVLFHPAACHGIVNFTLYFRMTDCSLEELSALNLLPSLLLSLPTGSHSAAVLQQLVKTEIGNLSFDMRAFPVKGAPERCVPVLVVTCSLLEANLEKGTALICEILTDTRFDDLDTIRSLVLQAEDGNRQGIIMGGHQFGYTEALAHYSAAGAAQEAFGGFSAVQNVHALAADFDAKAGTFTELCANALRRTCCFSRLTLGITAEKEPALLSLLTLPAGKSAPANVSYTTAVPEKLGIAIPAPIAFAVQGWNCGSFDGGMMVAAQLLSLDYLWNNVRVQGGAYGAGMRIRTDGSIFCYSYRDPTPARSLGVYTAAADALEKWCDGDEDLSKYIISTIAGTEPLQTPLQWGLTGDECWFTGRTFEERAATRKAMLGASRDAIHRYASMLREYAEKGSICVVASADALASCDGLTVVQA